MLPVLGDDNRAAALEPGTATVRTAPVDSSGFGLLLVPQAVWELSQGLKDFLVFGLWDWKKSETRNCVGSCWWTRAFTNPTPEPKISSQTPRAFDSRLRFNLEEQRPKGIVNIPPMTDKIYFDTGFAVV